MLLGLFGFALTLQSCGNQVDSKLSENNASPVEWSKNAVIYEVNIRQYSEEGTFKAFEEQLPRLKEMGVDILWLMPIHPISEVKRKGTVCDRYSVANYTGINSEFGNEADFKSLVDKAHALGFKVIG